MSYASIMTYVDDDEESDNRIRLATELAETFHATVIGVAARAPRAPVSEAGEMVAREIEAEVVASSTGLAKKEKRFFAIACRENTKAEWRSTHVLPSEAVAEEARAADLLVIGNDLVNSDDPFLSLNAGTVILRAGRPVLVVPPSVRSLKAKTVLIAWQDSREARRAVRDGLPFLQNADEVLLAQVCEQDEAEAAKASLRDVTHYLSRHRIGASAGIRLKASGGSATDELLKIAESERVDLIVLGAYGHSRLGEWVFGGVTRDLLARAPICCLFSH